MANSEDLPVEKIVENLFYRFKTKVDEKLCNIGCFDNGKSKTVEDSQPFTNYDEYLKTLFQYSHETGGIENIAKTFIESLVEMDAIPRQKFGEIKKVFSDVMLREYADPSLAELIKRNDFKKEEGKKKAAKLYYAHQSIISQRMVSVLGDVKNDVIRSLKKGTITDEKTGIYNRKHLDERLAQEVERVKRKQNGTTVSFVMFDIDDFTSFNTQYGHQEGDRVLKYVAEALREELRKSDIAARYGGEEFALVLPDTTKEEAIKLVERKMSSISNYVTRELRKTNKQFEKSGRPVTLCAGISTLGDDAQDAYEMVNDADDALYLMKANGKKGFCHFDKEEKAKGTYAAARIRYNEMKKNGQA